MSEENTKNKPSENEIEAIKYSLRLVCDSIGSVEGAILVATYIIAKLLITHAPEKGELRLSGKHMAELCIEAEQYWFDKIDGKNMNETVH